jgi:hypothetical protein
VGGSATATLTIGNSGTGTLTWSSISTGNAVFTVSPSSGTVAAGGSAPVTVTFSPTAAISYSATLGVTSDATSGTSTIAESGTGAVGPSTVSGTVTDATSHGILPNINIVITDNRAGVHTTTTDGTGRYSLPGVAGGPASLVASADGYVSQTINFTVGGNMTQDIVLVRVKTAVGTWAGSLVSHFSNPDLAVSLTITQSGATFAATCSQQGPPAPTVTNGTVQSFGTFGVAGSAVDTGFRGLCGGIMFQMVFDPPSDLMINVQWLGGDYSGTLTRQ